MTTDIKLTDAIVAGIPAEQVKGIRLALDARRIELEAKLNRDPVPPRQGSPPNGSDLSRTGKHNG